MHAVLGWAECISRHVALNLEMAQRHVVWRHHSSALQHYVADQIDHELAVNR